MPLYKREFSMIKNLSRRQFVQGIGMAAGTVWVSQGLSAQPISAAFNKAYAFSPQQTLTGNVFDLVIGESDVNFTGNKRKATTVNGSLPAPTLRFKEGETVTIRVKNNLQEDTSIHWHGILVPSDMDGVPQISFAGIKPEQTFTYTFPIKQSGTYWYHSHSGFQEQTGLMGAIIIDPIGADPIQADREHVIVLSDWTDENPMHLLTKLKAHSDFDNYKQPTLMKLRQDVKQQGLTNALAMRQMWNQMRMTPTDFSDLSGVTTYTYLMNGIAPDQNWTGLFNKGEKIRLRVINASAQTIFDFRIPHLKLTVIGTDGGLVEPVTVDELRIGSAETYDILVEPKADAYTIFAQNIDRSGFSCGTLAVAAGLHAPIPPLDPVQWLTMTDMMGDMQSTTKAHHAITEYGWSTDNRVDTPRTNLNDPGINLRNNGRRVLTYADLHSIGAARQEQREPTRELELHLTGNMERYVWGFDGQTFAESKPVFVAKNERVRISLVNDTMMTHPMHLHGMWSDLRSPTGDFQVRKHTIVVQPAQKISFDINGEMGSWAWHCHLLYHMESGMFREMVVG
jgi:FtsP/CotA-like multicopper oxidase with cupredoxin domain